jgi:hypothetical protein
VVLIEKKPMSDRWTAWQIDAGTTSKTGGKLSSADSWKSTQRLYAACSTLA